MKASNVRIACCTHYIPEAALGRLSKAQWLYKILKFFFRKIINRWESATVIDDAFHKCLISIDKQDKQVEAAGEEFNVVVARSFVDLKSAFYNGKMVILHTLEGAHQLGSGSLDPQHYIKHLELFKQKGVCSITISHFFPNAVCGTGGGIPPSTAKKIGYQVSTASSYGLTPVGKVVVNWCQQNGMIICFKHSNSKTRKDVYAILQQREDAGLPVIPVAFTHCGIKELAAPNMTVTSDIDLLPDIAELKIIKKFKGVIGLILMNYWLIGIEEDNPATKDDATQLILRTIACIAKHLGDYENIAIGTDLDGFTQVPDDLKHVRFLKNLANAIEEKFGRTVAQKICFDNAWRLLENGWLPGAI